MDNTLIATYEVRGFGRYYVCTLRFANPVAASVLQDIEVRLNHDSVFHFRTEDGEMSFVVTKRIPFHGELLRLKAALGCAFESNYGEAEV